jgi:hypothetical protein
VPRPDIQRTGERLAIATALNTYMEKAGCSQIKLAKAIGIPRLSLINYLECRQTPRSPARGKLKAFFGQDFPKLADEGSAHALAPPSPVAPVYQSIPSESEISLETHDSLVSARLTRKRPNSLELVVEIRRTGSD